MLNCYFNIEKIRDCFAPQQDRKFFDYCKVEELRDPICAEIVRVVDKSELVSGMFVKSPWLGNIPIERLSSGAKTLILLYQRSDLIFRCSSMGDNCAGMLQKISNLVDCNILLSHSFRFMEDQIAYFPQYDVTAHGLHEIQCVKGRFSDDYEVWGPDYVKGGDV